MSGWVAGHECPAYSSEQSRPLFAAIIAIGIGNGIGIGIEPDAECSSLTLFADAAAVSAVENGAAI